MNARPLKVLFAIEDRQTLRHCARLLTAFGQQVSTAASPELAMARLRADRPDLLVVGGRQESALAQLRAAVADDPQHQTFKLLLVNDPTSDDMLKGLEAGADDFLTAPVEPAELLTRLRTAARILEFERRFTGIGQHDATTGMLNRSAFLLRLQGELQSAERSRKTIACLVLQPDAYAELWELHGLPVAQCAMCELVARIKEDRAQLCGRLDDRRIALSLPGTAEETFARAEQIRTATAEAGFPTDDADVPWTISVGLAIAESTGASAAQLLERAEKALLLAENSGGNQVARYEDDVLPEEQRWADLASGRLFEGAVMRNIMVPFPRLLRTTDSLQQADAVLKQTRLAALPVVDEDGKLAGLLSTDRPPVATEADTPVAKAMNKEAVSFDEATMLPVLIDYFTREAPPVVVAVYKGRPTGLVTPESLGTLVQPLSTDTFAPPREATGLADLVVPHLCIAD